MGKKRRLRSAQAKFGIKHGAHPRMALLNSQTETVASTAPSAPVVELATKVEPEPEVEVVVAPTEPVKTTVEAVVTKGATTKPKAKTTTTKKRPTATRTARKKKAKKKTSSEASA